MVFSHRTVPTLRVAVLSILAAMALSVTPALADAAQDNSLLATTLTIPYGSILAQLAPALIAIAAAIFTFSWRLLPGPVAALASAIHIDDLLQKAIASGINSIAGAAAGETLKIDVVNPVLGKALEYVLEMAPSMVPALGGPVSIAKRIWPLLDLPAEASAPDFEALFGHLV